MDPPLNAPLQVISGLGPGDSPLPAAVCRWAVAYCRALKADLCQDSNLRAELEVCLVAWHSGFSYQTCVDKADLCQDSDLRTDLEVQMLSGQRRIGAAYPGAVF